MRQPIYSYLIVFILTYLIFNQLVIPDGSCEEIVERFRYEYGLSLLGGAGDQGSFDVEYYAGYPRWGWFFRDRWELEFEGNIGHYRLDTPDKATDMTSLGLNGLVVFQFLQSDRYRVFLTGGGGLIYLDLDERPRVGDSSVVGLAQGGVGVKFPVSGRTFLRLEYRFQHVSDPFDTSDSGWNYHCLVLGLSRMKK